MRTIYHPPLLDLFWCKFELFTRINKILLIMEMHVFHQNSRHAWNVKQMPSWFSRSKVLFSPGSGSISHVGWSVSRIHVNKSYIRHRKSHKAIFLLAKQIWQLWSIKVSKLLIVIVKVSWVIRGKISINFWIIKIDSIVESHQNGNIFESIDEHISHGQFQVRMLLYQMGVISPFKSYETNVR